MRKLMFPLMIVAILVGLFEQSKDHSNVYIMVIAVIIFMYGAMRLSAKIPSKHSDTEEEKKENDK